MPEVFENLENRERPYEDPPVYISENDLKRVRLVMVLRSRVIIASGARRGWSIRISPCFKSRVSSEPVYIGVE